MEQTHIIPGACWALVPARGGSKSIPLKNIHPVAGRPLLSYCLRAAADSRHISRIICSTDHAEIKAVAQAEGAEVLDRAPELSGDDVASIDVALDALRRLAEVEGHLPEVLALIQPTSIFLTPEHADEALSALLGDPRARSVQTVVRVPHHHHAFNQRRLSEDGREVAFAFPEKRMPPYNRQSKPVFYALGNFIATRVRALLEGHGFFAAPSTPVEIPLLYGFDMDAPEDVPVAEAYLRTGLVRL
ncbi:MAG: acylneuraminate cytidylyltransferase family protein [Pseudodesulfovibrio sp.]|uniref:acylneuraminate cytidylyltransferase family protein n=1 Tax=Pseudodesulfovibrio sp. TaxID=2035812 RepID=UPI003D1115BE